MTPRCSSRILSPMRTMAQPPMTIMTRSPAREPRRTPINTPMAGIAPVAPKSKMFYLAALLLGLAIPVGIIYLRNLLRFKIENRADVEALTSLPIVGDVPLLDGVDDNAIRVRENKNEQIDEIYRSIRTNILYMLRPGEKVVLFTSTVSGEGKSTNIGNVGASLAFTGKKVVVVGLDIRKPGLNKVFRQPSKESGRNVPVSVSCEGRSVINVIKSENIASSFVCLINDMAEYTRTMESVHTLSQNTERRNFFPEGDFRIFFSEKEYMDFCCEKEYADFLP